MAELFKDLYNDAFFEKLTATVQFIVPDFNAPSFLNAIHDDTWEDQAFKQRMRHIAIVLEQHLPGNFEAQAEVLLKVVAHLVSRGIKEESVEFMFLPDFIELFGGAHFDTSVKAFERITQFTSCEFAVRPFIINAQEAMMAQMNLWATHEQPMVRRLATEGCRPRLPWAMAIPAFKKDPAPILPILEQLKNDSSESVRRSVANNLNDISKDNPDIVIQLAKAWKGQRKETDWVVKHACRTLLKQGNTEVLELFGFSAIEHISVADFAVTTPVVRIGEALEFAFKISNKNTTSTKIRLEYGIYFQKANGSLSRKVFKISEKSYAANSTTNIIRKQPFKIITTRKLYPGLHRVSLIINGKEMDIRDFQLEAI